MAASVNDKITDTRNAARPNSARVSSGRSAGGATLACDNLAGWPTASKVHFVTYTIDSNSVPVAGTQLDCYGIVSGNNIGSMVVVDGTDTGNSVNDVVEMLPTAAWGQDLADALTAEHTRTGTHKSITNTGGISTDTLTVSSGTTLPAGDIGTADIASSAVDYTKVAAGFPVQVVSTNFSAVSTGTTVMPIDDTIPQITEGDQYMTQIITPKSATNTLLIEVVATVAFSVAPKMIIGALFQDATANALAAAPALEGVVGAPVPLVIHHSMTAGTVAATTFRFRAGGESAGTVTFNGAAGGRYFGGITVSSMTITEIKV